MILRSMGSIINDASKIEKPKDAIRYLRDNCTHPAFKVLAKYWVQENPFTLPPGTPSLEDNPKKVQDDPYVDGLYHRAKTLYVLEKHGSLEYTRQPKRESWYLTFIKDLVPEDVKLMEYVKDGVFPGFLTPEVIAKAFK